ncbi:hypothetical protein [Fibrella arboris]|uniref:hypothetical protein n=1 Tax=Fibrella arboris TaxID=3242486 RepID=UPI0035218FE3
MQTPYHIVDRRIKAGLLLFWALYFSVVWLSNTTDALKALNLLPTGFRFVSGNYSLVSKVVGMYGPTAGLAGVFFAGVISWEGIGAVLFWQALIGLLKHTGDSRAAAHRAFGATIGLWAAFILTDEVFLAYEFPGLSTTFFNLFIAEVGSLILFRLPTENARIS